MLAITTIATIDSADPRLHAENIQHSLQDLIEDVRQDLAKVEEPEFRTLLETTAEVLAGLQTAFKQYNERAETSFVQTSAGGALQRKYWKCSAAGGD